MGSTEHAWPELSDDLLHELQRRSQSRIEASEEFAEIKEQLAKQADEDDVIHLAELIREREEAAADASKAEEAEKAAAATDEAGAGDGASATSKDDETKAESDGAAYNEAGDEEQVDTPQREEAIHILADLVELQDGLKSRWHVPQSASRSEPLSSQP
jgi:hypothetical protein